MNDDIITEHVRQAKLTTIIPVSIVILLSLTGIIGIGIVVYMALAGDVPWWRAIVLLFIGILFVILFGYTLVRYINRMYAVKMVSTMTGKRLEIVTWYSSKCIAKLPEDVRYVLSDKDKITVALKINNRNFVIDSAQYTDSMRLNEYLKKCGQQ